MYLQNTLISLSSFLALVSAHFDLISPTSRGSSHDTQTEFPCGGKSVSNERTAVSIDNPQLSVQLEMGHDQSAVQILLALGEDPGDNFNITLAPTFREAGMGEFCLQDLVLSEDVLGAPLTEGLNATLQVVTNGDPTGGLYNCADLTFSSNTRLQEPECNNGTGIQAEPFSGDAAGLNANESTPRGQAQSGSGGGHGNHGSEDTSSGNLALPMETAAWAMLGAAVVGGFALL